MNRTLIVAAVFAVLAGSTAAHAQSGCSLVDQLKPRTAGEPLCKTRGIVPLRGNNAPAPAAGAPSAPGTQASAGADAHPSADLDVRFASGSAEFTPAAIGQLDDLGRALSNPVMGNSHFLIEGHTDTVGDTATNQALSEQRALAVVNYLVTHFHIPLDRLTAKGVGESDLLVATPPQTSEPANRRVHVVNLTG
jgi:outer membrane protein OmpA-like peptidoglycan-associated protein